MRSLAVLLVALAGLITFQGCGSDTSGTGAKKATEATCGSTGSSAFCPMVGMTPGCCVNNACGIMMNGGCVPMGHYDAGAK